MIMDKKPNHIVLKITLSIILILIVALVIHTIHNYLIIDAIIEKQSILAEKTNFYYTTEDYNTKDETNKIVTDHYTKDAVSMLVMKR